MEILKIKINIINISSTMDTLATRIARHAGLVPYLTLGIYRGKVPPMPNANFAMRGVMITCAFYAYDVENPTDKSQRIRVHQDAGVLGYYVLGPLGFRFQPVDEREIRIITGLGHTPIMYSEYLEQQQENNAEKDALEAEKKAREARAEAQRALAYAEQLEREAKKAREYAKKVSGSYK